jgi:hypothetical protein
MAGPDWSRIKNVDGKETVVNQPMAFPLRAGKTWDITYTEHNPDRVHTRETWSSHFKVVGYENVEVPAGKFNAIKIEAEGDWSAEFAPTNRVLQAANSMASGTTVVSSVQRTGLVEASGHLYKAFWYVPETGRWVKSVEEYYSSGGVRNEQYTSELESYKLSER